MTKLEKIMWDYWFENHDTLLDTLQNSERDWENNLFFENAMCCVKEVFELFDLYHNEKE